MRCPHCQEEMIRAVENGGKLLRGRAPVIRIDAGQLVIEQRCPTCKRKSTFRPLAIRLRERSPHGNDSTPG